MSQEKKIAQLLPNASSLRGVSQLTSRVFYVSHPSQMDLNIIQSNRTPVKLTFSSAWRNFSILDRRRETLLDVGHINNFSSWLIDKRSREGTSVLPFFHHKLPHNPWVNNFSVPVVLYILYTILQQNMKRQCLGIENTLLSGWEKVANFSIN
jgi:hypothetical protein